jgi:hypothetical protein
VLEGNNVDPILQALIVLGGTASLVIASGARHTALSDRMRKLTEEWRELAKEDPSKLTEIEKVRELSLLEQIPIFKYRCSASVFAHIFLYLALAGEVTLFGIYFFTRVTNPTYEPSLSYKFGLGTIFALLALGVLTHWANTFGQTKDRAVSRRLQACDHQYPKR